MTKSIRTIGLIIALWLISAPAASLGEASKVTLGVLKVSSNQPVDIQKSAIKQLLSRVEERTSITVGNAVPVLTPESSDIFKHPFIVLHGSQSFDALSDEAIENLRRHLASGGFLYVDAAGATSPSPFFKSSKRLLKRLFPNRPRKQLGDDHVLYKSFYLTDNPIGRLDKTTAVSVIQERDRLLAVMTRNDLLGAWAKDNLGRWLNDIESSHPSAREYSFRFGINLVMYALCINYKADQVHIPFILKRRGRVK